MTSSDPMEQYEKTISELKLENKKLKNRIENGCKLIMELFNKCADRMHHNTINEFSLNHIFQLVRVCHFLNGINGSEDDSDNDNSKITKTK
tara:strand:+ start:34 stop:306 length:273 start_codon:yes stop_codon:yes gene_type:complete